MKPHMSIETSLPGIRYLLEANDTLIVAVDDYKTLRFYEIIDKVKKDEEEREAARLDKIHSGLKECFEKYDLDKSGSISWDEYKKCCEDFFGSSDAYIFQVIYDQFDVDRNGVISKYELRAMVELFQSMGFLQGR